jgi:sec-independent protein translocase protein TatC
MATFVGGFLFAGQILKAALKLIKLDEVVIATTSPFQFVTVAMDVGFFLAIMVSAPYIVCSFYTFIAPALTRSERVGLLKSIPISLGLFVVGFLYGFGILYYSLGLFADINTGLGIANIWNISQFLSEIFITAALLGFIFEFPLLLTLLVKLRVITAQFLRDKRRIAYFCIFFITALLPPTDVLSLVAMVLPMVLLYEVTILLNSNKYHVWIRNH